MHIAIADLEPDAEIRVFSHPSHELSLLQNGTNEYKERAKPASVWIADQMEGVNSWIRQCAITTAKASFSRITEGLPWRDKLTMDANAQRILDAELVRLMEEPARQVTVDVDAILRPLKTILSEQESIALIRAVTKVLGKPPNSFLQTYEVVYHFVVSQREVPPPVVQKVYHELFV